MADARPHVTQVDSAYDRFIRVMRIVLPVVAAVLAVLTVFWPIFNDKEVSFTLSQEKIAGRRDKVRMIRPQYRGIDNANRPFVVAAESGIQDSPEAGRIVLEAIRAEMALEGGRQTRVSASRGVYLIDTQILRIEDGVTFETEDGYRLTAPEAIVDLRAHEAEGLGGVQGTGPLGDVRAGRFVIRVDDREALFDNNVAMTIRPRRDGVEAEAGNGG